MMNSDGFRKKGLYALYLVIFALCGCSDRKEENSKVPSSSIEILKRPNIIVLLTDQERYPTHWPEGWCEDNLPSSVRLKKHGLTFHHAYTSSSMCSPSRAVLMTGEHYPINTVYRTLLPPGLPSAKQLMDIGELLKEQTDYDVVWKGKWHLSYAVDGVLNWSEKDIANLQDQYALSGWNPPDAGNAIEDLQSTYVGTTVSGLATLGGGTANNDGRYVKGMSKEDTGQTPGYGDSVVDYLEKVGAILPNERKPFCLFISLVNPHDVWVYPCSWQEAGYKREDFAALGISLPSNFADDLTTKPSVQRKARAAFNASVPLTSPEEEKEYVNFYAYLHKAVDKHIETILDALDANGLTENTIIIRTADHGELGLSHGMREKAYTVYEEMIHVPLVISNPQMYPSPQTTDSFYCHLDLLPTLAELAGIPSSSSYGKGVSIAPILQNSSTTVQDSILFTFDDEAGLPYSVPGGHIRAIREGDWTYAVYYSTDGSDFEYEMYNLENDPGQLINLLFGTVAPEIAKEAIRLHDKLKQKIDESCALPADFPWPGSPFKSTKG